MTPIINAETITAIQTALAPVAEKIGQGAEYVWTTVVTQQYVIGISLLIWAGFTMLGALATGFFTRKCLQLAKQEGSYSGWEIPAIFLGIATMVLPIIAVVCLTNGVMHLINPGYYALEFFITLGKSATGQ